MNLPIFKMLGRL